MRARSATKQVRLGVVDVRDGNVALFFETSPDLPAATPILCGPGTLDQICGQCDRVLIHGFELGQVTRVILRCPACGAYNATDPRSGKPPKKI